MIRSVAKHSYIKGHNAKGRARAHINYIAHRQGHDQQHGGRKFFDRHRDNIDAREVRQLFHTNGADHNAIIHKLMLSPGLQEVDLKEYTRELIEKLEQEKGLDLQWKAVIHDNTEHRHVHIVILGTDNNGQRVLLNRQDHKHLRQHGDEYLDREHKLERYLDRELHHLLKSREYERGGDAYFQALLYGNTNHHEREKDRNLERDRQDFERFDKELRQSLEDNNPRGDGFQPGHKQRLREQQGRLSESHADYTTAMSKQRLQQLADDYPEFKDQIKYELEFIQQLSKDDSLSQRQNRQLDLLLGANPQLHTERTIEKDASYTFEIDRQVLSQQNKERDQEELDRADNHSGEL